MDDPRLMSRLIDAAKAGWTVLPDTFIVPKDGTEYIVYSLTRNTGEASPPPVN